jgi:hypothetical protein
MCEPYKHVDELAKDNPKGLEPLANPHGFSNNPGFAETSMMASPGNGETGTIRTAGAGRPSFHVNPGGPARRVEPVRNTTVGRSAQGSVGSVAFPGPGRTDPGAEGSPLTRTGGFGG